DVYASGVATALSIKSPGVLANDIDDAGYPLTAEIATQTGVTVTLNPDGSFEATVAPHPGSTVTPSFTYTARSSQGTASAVATVNLTFPAPSGLAVSVVDGQNNSTVLTDYRWIIEEDRTFFIDPNCQTNPLPAGCPTVTPQGAPAIYGTNFHTSYMPLVAQGCVGPTACDSGGPLRAIWAMAFAAPAPAPRRQWIPARSCWIRPSTTTSRSCPAMRWIPTTMAIPSGMPWAGLSSSSQAAPGGTPSH